MRISHLVLLAAVVGLLAACEDEPQTGNAKQQRWTDQEQVHRENGTTTTPRPAVEPEERLQQFFDALRSDQPQQAAALVSAQSLEVSEAKLLESLRQWSGQPAERQEFEIIDSRQTGDFALVRARFMQPGSSEPQPLVRPVIMFREDGEWQVVWDLLGMLPDQVAQFDPQVATRLDPLYRWYDSQQRTQVGQPGEATGGSPATEQALGEQGRGNDAGGGPRS